MARYNRNRRSGPHAYWELRQLRINGYGPSECTVVSCVHSIGPGDVTAPAIPIGRPVGDRALYLLDETGQPVPDGLTGEVCIGGPGVALGYVRRPALTAERFTPDPFGGAPGRRLYRTGDLARRRPDGLLEFAGRVDDQVKIRGFRVEPGEVVAVLRAHHSVLDAAVVPRRDERGACRELLAYVVSAGSAAPVGELRQFLKARLPEAMVPGAIVPVDRLPLTRNGKLDRAALPAPAPEHRVSGPGEHRAAATETEAFLVTAWEELLGVAPVSVTHNFFDLGGESLRAVQVMSRITRRFGVRIPVRKLYEWPQLAEFAAEVDRAVAAAPVRAPAAELRITTISREALRRQRTAS